jgi:hypothetical protein
MTMNAAARVMLLGWPLICLIFFVAWPARRALLFCVFAGWLFLPVARFELPGMPDYGRTHAIAVGAMLGVALFDSSRLLSFQPRVYDLAAAGWCLAGAAASLANNLGAYDAASTVLQRLVSWGSFYVLGRVYFSDLSGLRGLAHALFVSGLIYAPLCVLEMRVSPQLHTWIYGFHQHSFSQSFRGDGWRPVVFMEHGLAVGLWMALAGLSGLWLWSTKRLLRPAYLGIPAGVCVAIVIAVAVLCKSTGATVLLALGLLVFLLRRTWAAALVAALLAVPLAYICVRATGAWTGRNLVSLAEEISPERAESLDYRLRAEELLLNHALRQPAFGWGGFGRNRPVTFDVDAAPMATDGFWIIALGQCGFFGLACALVLLLLGPAVLWLRLPPSRWGARRVAPSAVASLVLVLFMIDCLFNAMFSPVYVLFAGGLTAAACAPSPRPAARPAAAAGAFP